MAEQPDAAHRQINEAGDSVPSSQDSVTRAVQKLACLGLSCGISSSASSATANNGEFQATAAAETTAQGAQGTPFAQCGPVADAHRASTVGGLMPHMKQKHGSQVLLEDSVGQLRWLNRQASVHRGTIRSQRCRQCNSCGFDTPLREAQASGRSGQWSGNRAATSPELAASASRRTGGRQPASELPPSETSSSLIEVSSYSPSPARPRRWHSRDAWSFDTPRLGQRVSREP